MAVLKKPYEISVWDEELNRDGVKIETKGAIIGAHDMTHLGRATQPKLQREVKGTNTLTFQMPTKFFDPEKGEYVKNELIENLYNEKKVKLFYDNEWYEFYVKSITENKQFKSIMMSFTCKDSFIDELSRTGYEIEFSSDLNNSVDEIGVFSETILDGSIWDYRPELNTGDFTEFNEERFYKIPLSQFGGSIIGYPIDLEVYETDLNPQSDYYKDKDFNNLNLDKELEMKNIFSDTTRKLQYGDDLSRVKEIFWDNYYKDNGRELLDDKNLITIESDYIYVPISQLSMIMGSVYNNAHKAIEEPALYGHYSDEKPEGLYGYALQPNSQNPQDLIQFICFQNNDELKFDEVNTLINNDHHYVIKIEQWNQILKDKLNNIQGGLIYWTSPNHDNDKSYVLTTKYKDIGYSRDKNTVYTYNVYPQTRTIDNFYWYPVFYEGYLNQLGDVEVNLARNISITDRTELNKNQDIYTKIYKQKDAEFKGLYSEKELDDIVGGAQEFRVCSKNTTRLIMPTLARNLVENGSKITDTNGWESKTQNTNNLSLGTGSYYKLLEVDVKSTVPHNEVEEEAKDFDFTGSVEDESVTDYYLEILSPYIEKSADISNEGKIESDYVLNFGFQGQDKKIEKDKVYAIRLQTGNMVVDFYNFNFRGTYAEASHVSTNSKAVRNAYVKTIKDFQFLINQLIVSKPEDKYIKIVNDFKKIKLPDELKDDTKNELNNKLINILKDLVNEYDKDKTRSYEKLNNFVVYPTIGQNGEYLDIENSDLQYIKYNWLSYNGKTDEEITTMSTRNSFYKSRKITNSVIEEFIQTYITENSHFEKQNNTDLDKIVIGKGSVDLSGNYVVDGIDNTDGDFISFSDLFEEEKNLNFIPQNFTENDIGFLNKSLYYVKENDNWIWKTEKPQDNNYCVEDNAFLLFKAKQTIENPYIAIKVDSAPAEMIFESIEESNYQRNNGIGVKLQLITPDGEIEVNATELLKEGYCFVDDCLIEIYSIDEKTFSQSFLESVGFNSSDGTVSLENLNKADREYGEMKDGDILASKSDWSSNSSIESPLYYNIIGLKEENGNKSYGYTLFVNKIYYGVFWLEKDYVESTPEDNKEQVEGETE